MICLMTATAGCALLHDGGRSDTDALRPRLGIWCEFMPYRQVVNWLPMLSRYDCRLLIHVESEDIGDEDFVRLCRAACSNGVRVTAWFLLPYDKSLYVGEETAGEFERLALAFADWNTQAHLGVREVVFDCEPNPQLGARLAECLRRHSLLGMARVLRGQMDRRNFANSVHRLNNLIFELHAKGLRVNGAANRVFLDFMRYGNVAVQDSLNAPFSMIDWDGVSFITYRYKTSAVQYVAMIKRYGRLERRYFDSESGLDVGLVGDHRHIPEHVERAKRFGLGAYYLGYLEGMHDPDDLRQAVSAALGVGVSRINIYSLEGAVGSKAGLEGWLQAAAGARPLRGPAVWTPFNSFKMGLTALTLEGLFRGLVGAERGYHDLSSCKEAGG